MRALNDIAALDNGLITKQEGVYRLKLETRDEDLNPVARVFIPLNKNGQDLTGEKGNFAVVLHIDGEAVQAFQADGDLHRIIGSGTVRRGNRSVSVNLFPASGGFIGLKPKRLPEGEGPLEDFV